MSVKRKIASAALACVLLSIWVVAAQGAQPVVEGIEIRGLQRIEEGVVRNHISQQAGKPLSPGKISRDIKSIYSTGYFKDVKVLGRPYQGGIKLIYAVKEKPTISQVVIYGNKEEKKKDIKKQVTITTGSVADTVLINDNALRIKAYYETQGFSLARVVPVVRALYGNRVDLTYVINEGPKIKIKKIRFIGNKALAGSRLKKVMKSKERWFFSFLTKSGYYKKDDLFADSGRIRGLYYDHGYIQATVSAPGITLTPNRKWAMVTYRIHEGSQFRVSGITITGNKVISTGVLRGLLKSRVGKPVSRKLVREDVVAVTERYSEHGYALAVVSPDLVPDTKNKTVSIAYRIDEGSLYHVGKIEISGNQKTRDWVIRRELLLNEGDIFNSAKLRKSYQDLNNLNFFSRVNINPQPVPATRQVNLDVNVKEKPTGFLSIGGGYSSVDKVIGMVNITQGNLGGRGQSLKISGELGGLSSYYDLSFNEPWLFGKRMSLTTDIYKQTQDYLDYTRDATGFDIGLNKAISIDTWVGVNYRLENATISGILNSASPVVLDQQGTKLTSSITPSIVRDTRDNYLLPHTGSRNSLSVTFAGLGGDNKFLQVVADSGWFFPISRRTTLSLHGILGYGTGLFGSPMPLYERFYVGGIYTVRGLGYGDGGPQDINGEPIGGLNELVGNVDYIYPLIPAIKLYGDVFADAGSAYDSLLPTDIRYTTGTGIRWISPIGPIRIEWGWDINKKPDEKSNRVDFTFGTFF